MTPSRRPKYSSSKTTAEKVEGGREGGREGGKMTMLFHAWLLFTLAVDRGQHQSGREKNLSLNLKGRGKKIKGPERESNAPVCVGSQC
jgi:hypothetical protein